MKRAFTLIELLIVIGIIGLLTGVLLGTFSGSTESARSAQCLSNMKNLANVCLSNGKYPPAESTESAQPDIKGGMANAKMKYTESVGWISWYSKDLYPSDTSRKEGCRKVGLYSDVLEEYRYALSHGAIYKYVGGNTSFYVCPAHKDKHPNAHWSYFMNPKASGKELGNFPKADRTLLFGEIPFRGPGDWFPSGSEGTEETDAVLQCEQENIGANHKNAKIWVAHVVFADGHVERLRAELSGDELKKLTKWLCEGVDVGYNHTSKRYENLEEE